MRKERESIIIRNRSLSASIISPVKRGIKAVTVSYTHLDVYKRQILVSRYIVRVCHAADSAFTVLIAMNKFWDSFSPHICRMAVSYTHLDVYKRQGYNTSEEFCDNSQKFSLVEGMWYGN